MPTIPMPSSFPNLTNIDLEWLVRFYQSLDASNQVRLGRLLQWALGLPASQSAHAKVVRTFTNQPDGYNQEPTLLVAPLDDKGVARPNQWVLRIPFVCNAQHPLTVTLPSWHKADTAQETEIARGADKNFRPLNLDDFLNRPRHYVQADFGQLGADFN